MDAVIASLPTTARGHSTELRAWMQGPTGQPPTWTRRPDLEASWLLRPPGGTEALAFAAPLAGQVPRPFAALVGSCHQRATATPKAMQSAVEFYASSSHVDSVPIPRLVTSCATPSSGSTIVPPSWSILTAFRYAGSTQPAEDTPARSGHASLDVRIAGNRCAHRVARPGVTLHLIRRIATVHVSDLRRIIRTADLFARTVSDLRASWPFGLCSAASCPEVHPSCPSGYSSHPAVSTSPSTKARGNPTERPPVVKVRGVRGRASRPFSRRAVCDDLVLRSSRHRDSTVRFLHVNVHGALLHSDRVFSLRRVLRLSVPERDHDTNRL